MSAAREASEYDASKVTGALDASFDHEKLVSFKGNAANCVVFEY